MLFNFPLFKLIMDIQASIRQLSRKSSLNANQSKFKGKNDEPIKVAIYKNGEPIKVTIHKNGEKDTSELFASAKVGILAINGDFCQKGEEDWTKEEFDSNIVKERERMGPIMLGTLLVDLVKGEAILDDLVFRDNSSSSRNKMFKIGVRVLKTFDVRVKEGLTEPFRVKDQHGEGGRTFDLNFEK